MLVVDVTGGPGDGGNPLTMCAWVRLVSRVGGFGAVLAYEDSFFNVAPGFIFTNLDDQIYFTPSPGTNIPMVADPFSWCFIAINWDGSANATAMALDSDGRWTQVDHASAGANVPPFVFIGGETIGGGSTTPDADLLYRGVHVWKERKTPEFIRQQSSQLAPISEVNLWSTTYFYDLSTAQLGQSMVGRSWDAGIVTTWTVSNPQKVDAGDGVTPFSITFTGAIAQGDCLVAYLGSTGNVTPPTGFGTFDDTSGNNWRIVDARQTADESTTTWILVAENVAAAAPGANVATWTPVGMNSTSVFGAACEIHSSAGRPVFDVSDGAIGDDAAPTASHIATSPNGLQIGACAQAAGIAGAPGVGTSGYTQQEQMTNADALLASLPALSTHATTAGFVTGGGIGAQWTAQIVVFKALAAGWTTSPDEPPRPSTRSEPWEVGS